MANFDKDFSALDPNDFTFDANYIAWTFGMNPMLKELPSFADLGLYLPLSSNANNIAPVFHNYTENNLTYTSGFIDGSAVFDSASNTFILFNDDLHAGGPVLEMGFSFYAKQNALGTQVAFVYSRNSRFFNFIFENQNTLKFTTATQSISHSMDLSFFHLFTFNVRQNGDTDIFVNSVKVATLSSTSLTIATPENTIMGIGRSGGSGQFDGNIEQFTVLKDRVYTQQEIDRTWNSGNPRREGQYSQDNPTIRQNTPHSDPQLVSYGGYSIVASGAGSIGIRLSKDNYVTTEFWNGSSWDSAGSSYNNVATVNTNISAFSAVEQQISAELAFISDGFQQIGLSDEQINYAVNIAPTVNAGLDKPIGGQAAITDISNFLPYFDSSFSDTDGTVVQAFTSVNGGAFVEILQGVFATLLEAVQAYNFQASTIGIGLHTFTLKVVDNIGGEAQDSVLVTVVASSAAKIDDLHDWFFGTESEVTAGGVLTRRRANGDVLITQNAFSGATPSDTDITKVVKV